MKAREKLRRMRNLAVQMSGLPEHQIVTLSSSDKGRVRCRMWVNDPICHWCGIHTTLARNAVGMPPPTGATIDHLKSRPMGRQRGESTRKVLACMRCNTLRSRIQQWIDLEQTVPADWLVTFARNRPPEFLALPRAQRPDLFDLLPAP